MLLITEPSGARFPTGKHTVDVSPRDRARSGDIITSIRIDAVLLLQRFSPQHRPPLALLPPIEACIQRLPAHRHHARVQQPRRRRCKHHLRHSAGKKHLHRRIILRPVRQRIHQPRHLRDSPPSTPQPSAASNPPHAQSPEHAAADSSTRQTPHAPPSHSESQHPSECPACPCPSCSAAASRAPTASLHPARSAALTAPAQSVAATAPAPRPPPAKSPLFPETGILRPETRRPGIPVPPPPPA